MGIFTSHQKIACRFFLRLISGLFLCGASSLSLFAQDDLGGLKERYIVALNTDNYEARANYASQLAEKYRQMERLDESAKYLNEAIAAYNKINRTIDLLRSFRQLGELQVRRKQYQEAILSYREVIKQYKILGNQEGMLYTMLVVADLYNKTDAPQIAIQGLRGRAEPLSLELKLDSARLKTYNLIVVSCLLAKRSDQAEMYQHKYSLLADSMKQKLVSGITARAEEDKLKQAEELKQAGSLIASKDLALRNISEEKEEVEKRIALTEDFVSTLTIEKAVQEQTIADKEEVVDIQRKSLILALIVILIVLGLSFMLFRTLSANKRYVKKLGQQNTEILAQKTAIEQQKNKLEQQHTLVNDSLRYAERIQQSIMPSNTEIGGFFSDFFVVNRPKDIVSGDFYWFANLGDYAIVALADCTGHGVPGAFMSIIGHNLLYDIVHQRKIRQPGQMLELLNQGVRTILQQQNGFNDDGMDIAICQISKPLNGGTERKVLFAGAKSSMQVVDNRLLNTIKGTNRSIGGRQKKIRPYEEHELVLTRGNMIYFNTDGMIDQRNEAHEKYGSPRLHDALKRHSGFPPSTQCDNLLADWAAFQGQMLQLDDISMIGIRI